MNVVVAGTRYFHDFKLLEKALYRIFTRFYNIDFINKNITIISGCASGADTLGEKFASKYKLDVIKKPAKWDEYGLSAGFIRNKQMANIANVVIVFWDMKSKGSRNMIKIANDMGIPVFLINLKIRKIIPNYIL